MAIETTPQFRRSAAALPAPVRKILHRNIELLEASPERPPGALRAHRMWRVGPDRWTCSVGRRYRLLYRWLDGTTLQVEDVGSHAALTDKIHLRNL